MSAIFIYTSGGTWELRCPFDSEPTESRSVLLEQWVEVEGEDDTKVGVTVSGELTRTSPHRNTVNVSNIIFEVLILWTTDMLKYRLNFVCVEA